MCLTILTSNVSISLYACYGAGFRRSFTQTYLIWYDKEIKTFEVFYMISWLIWKIWNIFLMFLLNLLITEYEYMVSEKWVFSSIDLCLKWFLRDDLLTMTNSLLLDDLTLTCILQEKQIYFKSEINWCNTPKWINSIYLATYSPTCVYLRILYLKRVWGRTI